MAAEGAASEPKGKVRDQDLLEAMLAKPTAQDQNLKDYPLQSAAISREWTPTCVPAAPLMARDAAGLSRNVKKRRLPLQARHRSACRLLRPV
jgi:hypothetical protein